MSMTIQPIARVPSFEHTVPQGGVEDDTKVVDDHTFGHSEVFSGD